jgi:hypothetical protein
MHKETVVEEAKKVLDEYGKNYVSKVSWEDLVGFVWFDGV